MVSESTRVTIYRGMEQLVARKFHKLEVVGSSPTSVTSYIDQHIVWQVWWDRASAKHANFHNYPEILDVAQ